jgi:hypothetical protein
MEKIGVDIIHRFSAEAKAGGVVLQEIEFRNNSGMVRCKYTVDPIDADPLD